MTQAGNLAVALTPLLKETWGKCEKHPILPKTFTDVELYNEKEAMNRSIKNDYCFVEIL